MRQGDVVGPYTLVAELGAGGMGTVWSADGPEGKVALKVVHPHLARTPEFVERLRREGEIGMRVRHENVVATLGVGDAVVDGTRLHFLAMELVLGRTLRALLAELVRVPDQLCRHIGREVALGLAAIHAAGAVHRDLKPDNVLITQEDVVKVMDLGVVRLGDEFTRLSQPGAFVGSFHYAAPEQLKLEGGRRVDHRIDLHALGLVLYELSTGRHPFGDGDVNRLMRRVASQRPRRPSELNTQVSVFLEEVVMRLLEKSPDDRFATAAEVASLLGECEDSSWWRARATAIRTETRRPLRRIRVARDTALVGRDAELARLASLWEGVRTGDGAVVLVEGEHGIGKSRLLDEFASLREQAADEFQFLHGAYAPSGGSAAYGAFAAALVEHLGADDLEPRLAGMLRETPLLVPAFAALLRGDAAPPGTEPLSRDAVQTLFVRAFRALAAERPTLLAIDDLDLASDDGRAVFSALAAAVSGHRLMLAASVGPSPDASWIAELDRRGAVRIQLARLGAKDLSRLLVDAFRSERLAEELAFRIAAKSDGNPFFVFEILRRMREDGLIRRGDDGAWVRTQAIRDVEIPASVQEMLLARLDGLAPEDRHLLEAASCCGADFDPLLAGAALGMSRMAALQRLASIEKSRRLVRSAGRRYEFDHRQVREVVYEGMSELLREEYHGAIADALLARGAPSPATAAEAASHLMRAGRAADAAPYLRTALDHHVATDATAAAAALSAAFLASGAEAPGLPRFDHLLRHAEDLGVLGRRDDERAAIDQAIALADRADDAAPRARARSALGWHLTRLGRARDAVPVLAEAAAMARASGDPRVEQAVAGNRGSTFWTLGRYDEARAQHERQIELAQRTGDRRAEATARGNLGLVEYALARYPWAEAQHRRHLEAALALGDRRQASRAMGNLGIVCTSLGRWDEARTHIQAQLESARSIGNRRSEAIALGNLGNVLYALGRWADARAALEASMALSMEVEHGSGESSVLVNLGPLVAELGDLERAADALESSLSLARETGARYQEGYALFELGELAAMSGDAVRAASLHERALALRREIGHRDGVAESLVSLARVRAAEGAHAAAAAHLEEAVALCAELDLANFATLAAVGRALLPGGDAAAAAASLAKNGARMMLRERMEAHWLLAVATRDPEHAAAARRILDELVEHAPPECRSAMVERVPLHRAIARPRYEA
jgi:tetratricopeptide (TPR) repeat protein/tRNA A-37 threonylcarbamoyl transferase component Bud32